MHYDDPFEIYRSALFLGLAVYTLLTTAATAWQIVVVLRGDDPRRKLLRTYLSYQLVTVRLQPLAGELLQILLWCAVLLILWHLHPSPT